MSPDGKRIFVYAAALALALVLCYAGFPSHYYTFDSLALISSHEVWNIAHPGYNVFLALCRGLYRPGLGISLYAFTRIIQSVLIGTGFVLLFLFLARSVKRSSPSEVAKRIQLAFAVVFFAAFCGGTSRFTTILEEYAVTGVLASLAWGLWYGSRNDARSPWFVVAMVLLGATIWLDLVSVLYAFPVILFALGERAAKRYWSSALLALAILSGMAITLLVFYLRHRGTQYEALINGWFSPTPQNMLAFASAIGRLFVYLVAPSVSLARTAWGIALLALAWSLGVLLVVGLGQAVIAGLRSERVDPAYLVVGLGILVRVLFVFWWESSNSELMISVWILGLFVAAHRLVTQSHPLSTHVVRLALCGACAVAVANVALVDLPSWRWVPLQFRVLRQLDTLLAEGEGKPVIVTEKETCSVSAQALPYVDVAIATPPRGGTLEIHSLNMSANSPATELRYQQLLADWKGQINGYLAAGRRVYYVGWVEPFHFPITNAYLRSPVGQAVSQFQLIDFLKANYRVEELRLIKGCELYRIESR